MMQTSKVATAFPPAEPQPVIDAGSESVCIDVLNTGAHAVQVRSYTHFFEAHRDLKFDRAATLGRRLDRASGSGVRFQPGEIVRVRLVRIADTGNVRFPSGRNAGSHRAGEVKQRGLRRAG